MGNRSLLLEPLVTNEMPVKGLASRTKFDQLWLWEMALQKSSTSPSLSPGLHLYTITRLAFTNLIDLSSTSSYCSAAIVPLYL